MATAARITRQSTLQEGEDIEVGRNPFDDLSRGELLRLVQAYHSALIAARSVMLMHAGNELSSYWTEGTGGRALGKANYIVNLVGDGKADEASERIYRSFFRAADVLLFPYMRGERFYDWGVNDKGEMIAPHTGADGYRPIEWRDVHPSADKRSS